MFAVGDELISGRAAKHHTGAQKYHPVVFRCSFCTDVVSILLPVVKLESLQSILYVHSDAQHLSLPVWRRLWRRIPEDGSQSKSITYTHTHTHALTRTQSAELCLLRAWCNIYHVFSTNNRLNHQYAQRDHLVAKTGSIITTQAYRRQSLNLLTLRLALIDSLTFIILLYFNHLHFNFRFIIFHTCWPAHFRWRCECVWCWHFRNKLVDRLTNWYTGYFWICVINTVKHPDWIRLIGCSDTDLKMLKSWDLEDSSKLFRVCFYIPVISWW